MNRCPDCQRGIPDNAAFCIHCAAQLRPKPQVKLREEPATGATIRLYPADASLPVQAQPSRPKAHKRHKQKKHKHQGHGQHRHKGSLWPIIVIGILIVLATKTSWLGFLVLFGLLGFIRRPSQHGLVELLIFGGIVFLMWNTGIWPGILLLIIASHLFSGSRYGWRP